MRALFDETPPTFVPSILKRVAVIPDRVAWFYVFACVVMCYVVVMAGDGLKVWLVRLLGVVLLLVDNQYSVLIVVVIGGDGGVIGGVLGLMVLCY